MQLDPTTIIFALLAIFVVWRLKSVLGTRVDIERPPVSGPATPPGQPGESGKVIRLPGAADRTGNAKQRAGYDVSSFASTEKGRAGLAEIIAADPGFDPGRFVGGAKTAYEMIVKAFADGDKTTLGNLLSPEVYAGFATAIDQRREAGEQASTKLVSIDEADFAEGFVKNGNAQISLRFSAKMITATRNASGEVVQGDPDLVISTDDLWTFSKQIGSPDPTWRLIATESDLKA
ncbi:MAG: Tim44 domain-containing protein [Rhodoblastus sp.]|nr:Tim44 domain-containing protein [Rhodoblastus sp.]